MSYMKAFQAMVLLVVWLALAITTAAQTDVVVSPEAQAIQVSAVDDLQLVGSYYALPDIQAPAVLLLHELNASRNSWTLMIEPLLAAGYNVLAVDLRGQGETGGEQNWETAIGDVQSWLAWLQEQPSVQVSGISIIGADLGGNLALIGCENDPNCVTSIAVSPVGLGCKNRDCSADLPGVSPAAVAYVDALTVDALTDSSRRSPAILFASTNDTVSMQSIRQIASVRSDQIEVVVLIERGHGTGLLNASGGSALAAIIRWLDAHTPANLTPDAIETLVAAGDPDNGERLFYQGMLGVQIEKGGACDGCHFVDSEETFFAPGLLNVGQRASERVAGQSAAVYLYNSIVAPDSYVVEGFAKGLMPWEFDKGFTAEEIADLVAYLLSL